MYNLLGQPEKAIACFQKGVSLYPAFIEAHYNLGYTYLTRFQASQTIQDRDLALAEFKRTLDTNPRYTNALNNIGNIYFAQKNLTQAAEAYQTLLKYKNDVFETYYNLA